MQLNTSFLCLFVLLLCCHGSQLLPAGKFSHLFEVANRLDIFSTPQHYYGARKLLNTQDDDTCPTVDCVGVGQPCNQSVGESSSYLCFPNTAVCVTTGSISTCVAQVPAGSVCNPTLNNCVSGYTCLNNTCVLVPYVPPGYACTSDNQCFWVDNSGNYLNSTCINGFCYALPDGQACGNSYQCNGVSFCNDSAICQPYLLQGAPCDSANSGCGLTLCYTANSTVNQGTCLPYFNGPVGTLCPNSGYCNEGLYCNTSFQCDVPFTPTHASCSLETDCPNNEDCQCNYATGTQSCQLAGDIVIPNNAVTVNNNFLQCSMNSLCWDDACFFRTCKSALCQLLIVQQRISGYQQTPLCLLNADEIVELQTCAPSPSSSSGSSTFSRLHIEYTTLLLLVYILVLLC